MIEHSIESEEKLIKMLGYNLIGPDNSNRWLIVDENNNNIGFIQYKKLVNKDKKNDLPAIFGYHMEIESQTVHYNSTRKLNNRNDKLFYDTSFSYEFEIKRKDGDSDYISIDVGINPSLTLWSKEYGFINFRVDYKALYLNFKSKTEKFNFEETTNVKLSSKNKIYEYCLSYCDKNKDIESKDVATLSIDFKTISNYPQNKEQLEIKQRRWEKGKIIDENSSIVDGTIEDAILKHKMGIDSFNHFRFLINQILPFKQEVISEMLEIRGLEESEFSLFIPDLNSVVKQFNNDEENKIEHNTTSIKKPMRLNTSRV